jgi:hypothetical protein
VLVSIPNFSHWYPRVRTAIGRFDYDRRGILDADHVRFFTRRSFERLVAESPFMVNSWHAVGPPFEALRRGGGAESDEVTQAGGSLRRLSELSVTLRPSLFAYQYIFELSPARPASAARP